MGKNKAQRLPEFQNRPSVRIWGQVLACAFPLFLVIFAEAGHMQSVSGVFSFAAGSPGVFFLDFLMAGAVYFSLYLLCGRAWIAALALSVPVFLLSLVEFFKYDASRSHFMPQDLAMADQTESMQTMANLRVTPAILIIALLILLFAAALFFSGARIRLPFLKRLAPGLLCAALLPAFLLSGAAGPVLEFFGGDARESVNAFRAHEKFKKDGFLAFFTSETAQNHQNRVKAPEGYGESAVKELLLSGDGSPQGLRANVIVILSESFADFRALGAGVAPDAPYLAFDRICAAGMTGTAVVPTFGGYTCRTEFEMLSGLPAASLNDPTLPQTLFKGGAVEGIPALFSAMGYHTVYMHPYFADFYKRDRIYPQYGFDALLFDTDFDMENRLYGGYLEDAALFERAAELILETEEPVFSFLMTMQNHQPYFLEAASGVSELEFYLRGIEKTGESLEKLLLSLETAGEPVIVFFMGDHFPFFALEGNAYDEIGYGVENCSGLFEQRYLVWANFDADFSAMPESKVSAFYLPHHLLALACPEYRFGISGSILALEEERPLYTRAYGSFERLPALDILTYDRIAGRGWSFETGAEKH